jgi:carboxyl-terminal processing protease
MNPERLAVARGLIRRASRHEARSSERSAVIASLLLCLGAAGPLQAGSPALEAYEAVSAYRDRHAAVIWEGAAADADALRAVLADLERGLALMDEPLKRELAQGNPFLHYRRYNLLLDKLLVHARLGEADAALDALEAVQRIGWHPGTLERLLADPHVAALADTPRFARAREREAVAARLAAPSAFDTGFRAELDAALRVAGLSRFWSAAREGFVWFDQVPGLDWDRAYLDFIPQVLEAPDIETYWRTLMRFAALLGDGHTSVSPPEELHPRLFARPPLRTALLGQDVVVMAIGSPLVSARGLDVGDRVLSVDGEDVHAYVARAVAPWISASTPQDLAVRSYDFHLLAGPAERAVTLEVEKADGTRLALRLPREGYGRIESPPTETFRLREDGIAVLVTRQFGSDAAERLFAANLAAILEAPGLVLDLRGNGGGATAHGWDLLTWLSDEPLEGTSSRHRVGDALERARAGRETPVRWRELAGEPWARARARRYEGPVAMLVDARTYSAAEDTAAAFRLMRRGPIIGETTGGSTGQPLFLDLPGGGVARICVKRDTWPDGSDFVGVGIAPDIEVRTTLADVRAGRDPVLERALAYLREAVVDAP